MHLATYLKLLHTSERVLADSYRVVARGHRGDADVYYTCGQFADDCAGYAQALQPILARYQPANGAEPARLYPIGIDQPRTGPVGLLRDLQELDQLANLVQTTWTMVGQAAHAVRDRDLIELTTGGERDLTVQLAWLRARMRGLAPQALVAAGGR